MRPCWRARLRAKSLRNGPPHERSAHRFRCCRDNAAGSRPFGFLRYGVTPAGPMDAISHATALRLAGVHAGEAAIETAPGGLTVAAEGDVALGIAAPGATVMREGKTLSDHSRILLRNGETLTIRSGSSGCVWLLRSSGRICTCASDGEFGNSSAFRDRAARRPALGAEDVLPIGADDVLGEWRVPTLELQTEPLRFVPGPQDDYFRRRCASPAAGERICPVTEQ